MPTFIDIEKFKRMQMLHVQFLLFDLRSLEAFRNDHIRGAVSLPADDFSQKIVTMVPIKETPIVVYDQNGVGCGEIVNDSEKVGYLNMVILEGGFQAFVDASQKK